MNYCQLIGPAIKSCKEHIKDACPPILRRPGCVVDGAGGDPNEAFFRKELDAKIFIDIVMTLEPSVDRGRSSR
jgi:hypothetical protein